MGSAQRLDSEREYHDRRYEHETRTAARKYYSIDGASTSLFRSMLRAPRHGRVLEYGCGTNKDGLSLAREGVRVDAIDISSIAVDRVAAMSARLGVTETFSPAVMNAESLEFSDCTFDLVFGRGILHHLDLDNAYAELARVLKPNGRGVFVEPLGHNPVVNLYRRVTPTMRTPDEHPLVMADFTSAGEWFNSVDVTYFSATALAAVPFRGFSWFPRLLAALDRTDQYFFDRLPGSRRLAWTCVIEMRDPVQHR